MSQLFRVPAMRVAAECELALPGSKSHANRAIICACLASGRTVIQGATPCDDVLVMVENLKKMGFHVEWKDKEKGELVIDGGIPDARGKAVLDCHNAGTTIRFLSSVAAIVPGEWILTGDEHMRKRPIGDLVQALHTLGVVIKDTNGCPPIHITGGTLKGGRVILKADRSSQYLTSLLLIAPALPDGLTIELEGELTSEGYVDLTKKVMKDFDATVIQQKNIYTVQRAGLLTRGTELTRDIDLTRGTELTRGIYEIEGDWSAAGAWLVLNALTGSRITMPNLRADSEQSDRKLPEAIRKLTKAGDIVLDCSDIPDQVMNLCVFAAFRQGVATFTGIANLRKKECDRIHVIATELQKAGVDITEKGDDLVIHGAGSLEKISQNAKTITLDPHDDHRMAMAFAILGLIRGNMSIKNPECVKKSYPSFFADLETVLRFNRTVSIVGMRGVGKSALGRKLASKLGLKHVDSDHLFEKAHGPIRAFIAEKGWDEFRKREEEIIAIAIQAGIVLSLGGGALSSAKTRKIIKENTIPVWLQARESELIKRLQSGKRPPLTDLPLHEEVRKFLLERGPHYREVAAIEVSPTLRFSEQVPYVLKSLREIFLSKR